MDPDPVLCQWSSLRGCDDGISDHVQAAGYIEYGHRPVYQLVVFTLGYQAVLESIRGYSQDQESLDHCNATIDRGRSGWSGADDPDR